MLKLRDKLQTKITVEGIETRQHFGPQAYALMLALSAGAKRNEVEGSRGITFLLRDKIPRLRSE